MITGFNTDIEFDGKVFHVQTEDRGLKNPVVESLVYSGGEIVTGRKSPYHDLLAAGGCDEANILRRMEEQHRELIREIRGGRYTSEGMKPFGHAIVTNRSFDEVVLGFLEENLALHAIALELVEPSVLWAGEDATLDLGVTDPETSRPVVGADVVVTLVSPGERPRRLLSGRTDERGHMAAACEIPAVAAPNATVVCLAEAAGRSVELTRPVRRRAGRSVR